jgi:hypothetical protein
MGRYKYKTVGTQGLATEIEFASPDGGFDTEVRICDPTTLCWISGADVDSFTKELQALITKYAI